MKLKISDSELRLGTTPGNLILKVSSTIYNVFMENIYTKPLSSPKHLVPIYMTNIYEIKNII